MQFELLVNNMGILGMIPIILLVILMLWGIFASKGRGRTLSLLAFLAYLFVAISWLTTSLVRMDILTLTDWSNWVRWVDFGARGIWLFLLVIYVIILAFPEFFSERKWAVIVVLIGPIVYEILLYADFAISAATYGPARLATELVLVVLYMAVIPLYATYQYTRQDRISGSSRVMWIWLVFLGLLVWFFGEFILAASQLWQLPGYASFFSEIGLAIVSTHTIGWWIILVSYIFQRRVIQSGTS